MKKTRLTLPDLALNELKEIEKYFISKIQKKRGCWLWLGYRNKRGYGVFNIKNKKYLAHRISFMFAYGSAAGMCVLHKCDNPQCTNPKHLFLGTDQDNSDDKRAKGRQKHYKGVEHGMAKLSEQDVVQIRKRSAIETNKNLGNEYGVTANLISKIHTRQIWKHI